MRYKKAYKAHLKLEALECANFRGFSVQILYLAESFRKLYSQISVETQAF